MAVYGGPDIVTDGLVLHLDAANTKSYPGSGFLLYDLIGNVEVDFENKATLENKSLIFDGSINKIGLIPAPNRLLDSCTEVWFKTNGSQPSAYSMIFGYEHVGGTYSRYTTGPIAITSNNKIFTSVITSTQGYRQLTSNLTLGNNKFYHVCLNKDAINGTLTFYINGVFDSSTTFDADNLSAWPSAGNYIGRNYLDIGGYNLGTGSSFIGTGYLSGSVSIGKMYNKTLSSEEIAINYQSLKGRFGL